MATKIWTGNAQAVAQVTTVSVTVFDVTTLYALTIGDASIAKTKQITVIGEVDDGATATALAAAINNSPEGEWQQVGAVASGVDVIITSQIAGMDHAAVDSTTLGTGTLGVVATTANKSAGDWDDDDNWDDSGFGTAGTKPISGDEIIFGDSLGGPILNLDDNTLNPSHVVIRRDFQTPNQIGLAYTNRQNTPFNEYRLRALRLNFGSTNLPDVDIGVGDLNTAMSSVINLLSAVNPCRFNVHSTGSRDVNDVPPVNLQTIGNNNVLRVFAGDVGSAYFADEVANWMTIENAGTLHLSQQTTYEAGSTLTNTGRTTLLKPPGDLLIKMDINAGSVAIGSSAVVATPDQATAGITVASNATLRLTVPLDLANLTLNGTLDLSGLNTPITITNFTRSAQSRVINEAMLRSTNYIGAV